jgi:hypothetical protein
MIRLKTSKLLQTSQERKNRNQKKKYEIEKTYTWQIKIDELNWKQIELKSNGQGLKLEIKIIKMKVEISTKKRTNLYFWSSREKKKKRLIDDKPSYNCQYEPHREEMGATTHLTTWWKSILCCWETLNATLKG